jgi:hypothetical protein
MSLSPKEDTFVGHNTFIIDGGNFLTALLPARIIGFILIAVLLRYYVLDFGDTIIAEKLILYFGVLLGLSLGIYMLSVHPFTGLVARNAQAMEILEDFIDEEDKRLDFLVELKLYQEGTVVHPINGKGLATFRLDRKDRISILKINQ